MKKRGSTFWEWADKDLHHRSHDEELSDGTSIDVQVRLDRNGVTQLFIGVYRGDGVAILEEFFTSRSHETMTKALVWGAERARVFATTGGLLPDLVQDIQSRSGQPKFK